MKFTSQHLGKVLDRCFSDEDLDDHSISEEKEKGGQVMLVERTVKGLVPKCLDKDGEAFKTLQGTEKVSKEQRLSLLCECRPEGCSSAVDLALWLVEVRSNVHWLFFDSSGRPWARGIDTTHCSCACLRRRT